MSERISLLAQNILPIAGRKNQLWRTHLTLLLYGGEAASA
jgi:hypothetical protein